MKNTLESNLKALAADMKSNSDEFLAVRLKTYNQDPKIDRYDFDDMMDSCIDLCFDESGSLTNKFISTVANWHSVKSQVKYIVVEYVGFNKSATQCTHKISTLVLK